MKAVRNAKKEAEKAARFEEKVVLLHHCYEIAVKFKPIL